jgi:pimeloyl-ACP methyl ester carboxylesterase
VNFTAPDGARIFYRLDRSGPGRPVLVLLHGMASNSTRWNEFVRESRLAACCDLLRVDRRGQGLSAWRGRTGMREWCDDLAGILAAEGYAQAYVGGHCLGANVAIEFAARHPALTAGLVLVEPMPRESLAGTLARVARLRWLLHLGVGAARVANAAGLYRRRLMGLDLEGLDRRSRGRIAAGAPSESVLTIYASPFADLACLPTVSYLRDLLAVTAPLPPLESIRVPVLALVSGQSTMTDPARTRAALDALRDLSCVEIEARHWIPTEQPAAMRAAIDDWVEARIKASRNPARTAGTASPAAPPLP